MKRLVVILVVVLGISSFSLPCRAVCPTGDLNGDCFVDFADFAVLASQWLSGNRIIPPASSDGNMVLIPSGTFQMGDSFSEGVYREFPVHAVTLSSFFIGKYEITNQQYCDFLNSAKSLGLITVTDNVVCKPDSGKSYPYCDTCQSSTYSQIDWNGSVFSVRSKSDRSMANDPMVQVSWYGVAAYCNWRSQTEGKEQCYDLSTWNCDFNKHAYLASKSAAASKGLGVKCTKLSPPGAV